MDQMLTKWPVPIRQLLPCALMVAAELLRVVSTSQRKSMLRLQVVLQG